jgi:hypothetical protein
MTTLSKAQFDGNCPKCSRYQKQIAKLTKAFIKLDDESIRRCVQYGDNILKFKTEKEWLEAEDNSGSQSEKKALEKVDRPNSNANLRAPDSLNITNKEYDTKYKLAEDNDKSFDGTLSRVIGLIKVRTSK